MIIIKKSAMSGQYSEMDIPVTDKEIEDWNNGVLIQDAMPNLTDDEREFIMTGITPKEWHEAFGDDN